MPGYKGHITIGLIFGLLLVAGLALTPLALAMTIEDRIVKGLAMLWIAVVFALFPDVDIKSKGQMLFYRIFIVLDVILIAAGYYLEAALFGFLAMLPIISKHRGWTHTIWAMIAIPAPILLVPIYLAGHYVSDGLPFYLAAEAGYFSHLVADGMVIRRKRRRRS